MSKSRGNRANEIAPILGEPATNARVLRADHAATERQRRSQRSGSAHDALLAEMKGEQAAALGRAGRKLGDALAAARALLAGLDRDDPEAVAAYRARYAEAERARWELHVHRECLGLFDQSSLLAFYPLLPRV